MSSYIKFILFIVGFTTYMILSAPKTGCPNRIDKIFGFKSSLIFKIPFLPLKIHIHHWLYLLIIRYFINYPQIIWFCYGGIIQGIVMYNDFYKIVYFVK
jgi:hypothetical protein